MKPRLAAIFALDALALASGPVGAAADAPAPDGVELGMSLAAVKRELGEPRAALTSGDVSIVRYDSVSLRFRGGALEAIAAVDPEQAESRQDMLEWVQRERSEVGDRLLARYRASGEIEQRPPAAQAAFWRRFQDLYPEADASSEIQRAQERAAADAIAQREAERSATIAALQQRVAELEWAAEWDRARDARQSLYYYSNSYRHPHHQHRDDGDRDRDRPGKPRITPITDERLVNRPRYAPLPAGEIGTMREVFTTPRAVAPMAPTLPHGN